MKTRYEVWKMENVGDDKFLESYDAEEDARERLKDLEANGYAHYYICVTRY